MKYLFVVLVFAIFFGTGTACVCFECVSTDDSMCNDPFEQSRMDLFLYPEPCVCAKQIVQTLTRKVITRGAVLADDTIVTTSSMSATKATERIVSFAVHYCSGRGCNGANSTTGLFALIAVTMLTLFSYQQLRNGALGAAL